MHSLDTDFAALDASLAAAGCEAYVHVGDRFDDVLGYLTRFNGPDRAYAFVHTPAESILCAPSLFADQAKREFVGDTVLGTADQEASRPGKRAIEALEPMAPDRVLVDESIAVGTYRVLAEAFEVTSEPVDVGRERKTPAERACHERVQSGAQRGMARAESILAAARTDGDTLRWNGEALTTDRLRRHVNRELAEQGLADAGNTVIGAGPSCADLHFIGEDAIAPGETVLVDLSPRGPRGYYADLTRTFVPGPIAEWEKAIYEAVSAAQDAALGVLSEGAGIRAGAPHDAACATFESRGYETGSGSTGFYHGVGHGIGVSLHESPSLSGDERLKAGSVVTVEPGLYDPGRGGVRIEDIGVVTEEGFVNLTDYPRSLAPRSATGK